MADPLVVFRAEKVRGRMVYDLLVDGRIREYSVEPEEMQEALRRSRVRSSRVYVEDLTGYRQKMGR